MVTVLNRSLITVSSFWSMFASEKTLFWAFSTEKSGKGQCTNRNILQRRMMMRIAVAAMCRQDGRFLAFSMWWRRTLWFPTSESFVEPITRFREVMLSLTTECHTLKSGSMVTFQMFESIFEILVFLKWLIWWNNKIWAIWLIVHISCEVWALLNFWLENRRDSAYSRVSLWMERNKYCKLLRMMCKQIK